MPLTPNLSLNRPSYGTFPNTWDQPVNQNWDIIDALFSGSTPPGHKHDGSVGMGPQIDHTDLLSIGTKTHAELDAAFEKAKVSSGDTTPDYLENKIVAGANITITKLNPLGNEQLSIASTGGGGAWTDADEYGDKHTVPTSAPVAYTDNFTYPSGFTLRQADYTVARASGGGVVFPDFFATGYSAHIFVDPSQGDDPVGRYAATVSCQIPHGPAQRATCSITDIDYSDLVPGDFVVFTLSLFSTHRIGAAFPQKHGVLLEIHLTKLSSGPDVFQVSHRVVAVSETGVPATSFQVPLYQHYHTNPDHMKGVWEISMDSNGHAYHYWRRQFVFTTQTSPVSTPGPLQAYFSQLMANLVADGDPKYGAMGFGFHYGISPLSKFNFEFRWLTVTANSDIYDETPTCPGTADPYGIVDVAVLPKDFFFIPGNVPDTQCCPAPNSISVGEVLKTDPVTGDAMVWVAGCAAATDDQQINGVTPGYYTNISPAALPCESPAITSDGLQIFDLTGYWPEEGPTEETTGKVVIHGLQYLPPLVEVISNNPYFVVIDAVWLDYGELELKYEILPGGAGTDVDIDIQNQVDSARTLNIPTLATIQQADPEILSIEWIDTYLYSLVDPTAGYRFEATITGKGFTGATLSSPTPGVTVHSFTVDSPNQITADIEFDFLLTRGAPFALSVGGPTDFEATADYPTQLVTWVEFTAPAAPDGPLIGAGKAVNIHGALFGPQSSLTIEPVDPTQVANWAVVSVTPTLIQITFDIIAPGAVTTLLEVKITDNDSGQSITAPICDIGDNVALGAVGPAVTTPTTILCAGRKPGPTGVPPYSVDLPVGAGMNDSVYVLLSGPAVGPLYQTSGDSHTTLRGPLGVQGDFWNICGENMLVDITAIKPGVGIASIFGAFSMADPTPAVVSGPPVFSTPPKPGATGTVDFPFSAYSYLTQVESVSHSGVSLTNYTDIGTGLRYDFSIDSDVPPTTVVNVTFFDGACDGGPYPAFSFPVEYPAPVVTDVVGVFYEDVLNYVCTVKGTGFRVGATSVAVGGNATYVSHVDVDTETIELTISLGSPGAATIQITNTDDGQTSNIFPITVLTELAADVDHCEMVPPTTGTSATLYIYGDNLNPPGAVLAFTGFTPSGPPTHHNDSYIEQNGTITAAAGADVLLGIMSTSHSYPGLFLAKATAAPGGAVVINSIDNREPQDNQIGFVTTVFGENMDQIFSVEAIPTDPDLLSTDYQPVGPTPAVTVSILSKTVDHITLSVSIEKGVAYNKFDFNFYDAFVVLLATAPEAITVQPSATQPDIAEATRAILDGAIPSAAGAGPWSIAIPTTFTFGDQIVAVSGWTIVGTPTYLGGQWLIDGINDAAAPPVNWELRINSPANVDFATYRIPGGVTT